MIKQNHIMLLRCFRPTNCVPLIQSKRHIMAYKVHNWPQVTCLASSAITLSLGHFPTLSHCSLSDAPWGSEHTHARGFSRTVPSLWNACLHRHLRGTLPPPTSELHLSVNPSGKPSPATLFHVTPHHHYMFYSTSPAHCYVFTFIQSYHPHRVPPLPHFFSLPSIEFKLRKGRNFCFVRYCIPPVVRKRLAHNRSPIYVIFNERMVEKNIMGRSFN